MKGAFVGLTTAAFVTSPDRVIEDLVEAAWPTYARVPCVWGVPKLLQNGSWGALCTTLQAWGIAPTDPSTMIFGYFLADAITAGKLLGTAILDVPFPLTNTSNGLALVPELSFPPNTDWGRAALLG